MREVVAATVLSGMLVAVGVLGTIVPMLPGVLLVLVGIALFGLLTGWDGVAVTMVSVAAALAVASVIAGIRIPAKETGGATSRRTLWIGALGGIVGFFTIPVVGLPVGWVGGVFLSELAGKGPDKAWTATVLAMKSFGKAALVQVGIALAMAVLWGAWAITELVAS